MEFVLTYACPFHSLLGCSLSFPLAPPLYLLCDCVRISCPSFLLSMLRGALTLTRRLNTPIRARTRKTTIPQTHTPTPRRQLLPIAKLIQMAQITGAAIVESIRAPAESLYVRGPEQIWRAHGVKSAFVPVVPHNGEDGSTAAAAAATATSASSSSSSTPAIVPPAEIDRSRFLESVTTVALKLHARQCGIFQAHMRSRPTLAYSRARIGTIIDGSTKDEKFLLLGARNLEELALYPLETLELIAKEGVRAVLFQFDLTYDYFSLDHILRTLLPEGVTIPAGFETIGHIAHLNLSEEQRQHGKVIAQVILDKNPHVHTVVNKVGAIASEYRVFEMEVLGGYDSFFTEVKEHGCTFQFDFSKVYWNSRLSTEHARMIDLCFQRETFIIDMMCGIGPFVVPGAKRLGQAQRKYLNGRPPILANDLNPDSFTALQGNLSLNKVGSLVETHNLDGRIFLWNVVRRLQLDKTSPYHGIGVNHVLMNLPAIAIEFVDAFVGLYAEGQSGEEDLQDSIRLMQQSPTPCLHVYCFSREVQDPTQDLVKRIETALGGRFKIPKAILVKEQITPAQTNKSKKNESKKAQQNKKKNGNKDDTIEGVEAASASSSAVASASSGATPVIGVPPRDATYIRFVRNVAPSKDMFCVSFFLPKEVLTAKPTWKQQQQNNAAADAADTDAAAPANDVDASNEATLKRKIESEDESEHASKKSK